ncbi:tetratricopeptide repeat protein [Rhizobium herbae]|uniref:Tetratricopeptide repeat protein n=1 Tax=Rhizobium herbae TaxID=508661 RepID=A0ABS7HB47_9HYPH|nr:tetratricopeptide repeat protein [Rhizobium herbae]
MTLNRIRRQLTKRIRSWRLDKGNPRDPVTFHVSQGDAHNARKAWPEAIGHYQKALALSPNLAPIWIQLGHGLRETGQLEQAERSYLRALEIEPDNADATFFLGVTRSELAKRENGEEQARPSSTVPSEAPCEADEPLEFRFHARDLPSSWLRPEERSGLAGTSILRLSGHAVGSISSEVMHAAAIVRAMRAFHAISHPNTADDVVSVDNEAAFPELLSAPPGQRETGVPLIFGNDSGADLADIWFVNSRTLRLRFNRASHSAFVVLRCFQYDPADLQRLRLLAEQPIPADIATFVDVTTANPYFPLGFAVCTEDAELISFALLPYPSLCRGGLHFGELLSTGGGTPYLGSLEDVSSRLLQAALKPGGRPSTRRIEVDLEAATGTERIFERSLQFWLRQVLGFSIVIGQVPQAMDREVVHYLTSAIGCEPLAAPGGRNVRLRLSADAVPSLHSLLAGWQGRAGSYAAPFVLASVVDGLPKYVLSPPSIAAGGQTQGVQKFPILELGEDSDGSFAGVVDVTPPVAAIRFCRLGSPDDAQLLAPLPLGVTASRQAGVPERIFTSTVSVVHNFSGDEKALAAMLEALSLQQGTDGLQVLVAGGERHASGVRVLLQRFFPSRGHFIDCPEDENEGACLNRAAAHADGELILVIGETVLLHDPVAIHALASLMTIPGVSSASCILIGPQNINKTTRLGLVSSGYFPFAAAAGTEAMFGSGDILLSLPHAVWPAAFNSSRLFMVDKQEWQRIGGFVGQRAGQEELATPFWTRSMAEGRSHVITTAVSASLLPSAEDVVVRVQPASQFLPTIDEASRLSLKIERLLA